MTGTLEVLQAQVYSHLWSQVDVICISSNFCFYEIYGFCNFTVVMSMPKIVLKHDPADRLISV